MASSSENFPCPTELDVKDFVPKLLHEEHYKKWRSLMEDFIDRRGLKDFIDGTAIEKVRDEHDAMAWEKLDNLVQAWILATVSDDIRLRLRWLKSAEAMWIKLEVSYDVTSWQFDEEAGNGQGEAIELHKAVIDEDWEKAIQIIEKDPTAITKGITTLSENVLIVAVQSTSPGRDDFVKELLSKMKPEDVNRVDSEGSTALHYAALFDNMKAAKMLVGSNPELLNISNRDQLIPVQSAAWCGHREMVLYLMGVTQRDILDKDQVAAPLLCHLISGELYDIASYLLQQKPGLALTRMEPSPFAILADKHSSFPSGTPLRWWERLIYWGVPRRSNANNIAKLIEEAKTQGGDTQNVTAANNNISGVPMSSEGNNRAQIIEEAGIQGGDTPNVVAANCCITAANCCIKAANCCITAANCCISVTQRLQRLVQGCAVRQRLHLLIQGVAKKLEPYVPRIWKRKERQHHALELVKSLCKEVAKSNRSEVERIYKTLLRKAIRVGIPDEIVEEIAFSYPSALFFKDIDNVNFIKYAIMYRRERVFNLIHQAGAGWRCIIGLDESSNNGLHLAARLGRKQQINLKASAAGAILHMQRELQWFQEVRKFTQPGEKDRRNDDDKTPEELFSDTHQDLVKEGEQWMKNTAGSCTIVSALIVAMAFAAAITVPGGNNSNTGRPLLAKEKAFIIFGISDALALLSSITSSLMFLLILTSRYAEEDFLLTLPVRLIFGLLTLFFSILSTMIAFSAILFLVFGGNEAWILIPIAVLASIPAVLFAALQFPLLIEMIQSTYGGGFFGKRRNRQHQD